VCAPKVKFRSEQGGGIPHIERPRSIPVAPRGKNLNAHRAIWIRIGHSGCSHVRVSGECAEPRLAPPIFWVGRVAGGRQKENAAVKKIHSRGLVLTALVVVMTPILDVRQSLAQSSGGSSSSGASSGSSGSTSGTSTSPGVAGVPSAGGTAPVGRATAPSAVPTTPGQPGVGVTQPNPSGTSTG
jgi:hypothetical protein